MFLPSAPPALTFLPMLMKHCPDPSHHLMAPSLSLLTSYRFYTFPFSALPAQLFKMQFRHNLSGLSLAVPSLVLLHSIKMRKGTNFRTGVVDKRFVLEKSVYLLSGEISAKSLIYSFFRSQPALAAGVLISKRLVTLLVAVHVCFIFNLTSHLCSRACVRRIKCKQSESSAG